MIKVLLVDDQELIRQSLSFVMSKQEDIEMVGTAGNGLEALEAVETLQPDVVLLDIRMPEMDGVECTRRIKQAYDWIKVIVLTTFDDDEYVFDALRYGASGYLLKGISVDGLANAVREAAREDPSSHRMWHRKCCRCFLVWHRAIRRSGWIKRMSVSLRRWSGR